MPSDQIPQFAGDNPPQAAGQRLLVLFGPAHQTRPTLPVHEGDRPGLWRTDAIHRAKNMAQLTASLASLATHPAHTWLPQEVAAQARALARIYDEIGIDSGSCVPVPCAELLKQVATRLGKTFGVAQIVCSMPTGADLLLTPDGRRCLILIASELVINAMKYAFPQGAAGTITVALTAGSDTAELIVEDDGIGMPDFYVAGHGSSLIDRLVRILGGEVRRTAGAGGGLRIAVRFAIG